jgi:leucyl-tRNA synthetase
MEKYNPREIEAKWQKYWQKQEINQVDLDKVQRPFYNLMMFPYPSAEGLHVGNMYAFVHSDAYGRFQRLKGFDVFEPIGLDGFGIHSENYAIKIKEHIKNVSARTEKHFYEQLHMIGNQYDWSRTVETYKPNYYRWTQWLFLQMYKKGLAYRNNAPVNWCPSCKTVLSDEQVINGKCERCSSETEKRQMEQWFFRITDYAERLLKNLEWIDWSEPVKIGQRNWIGKSEGASLKFSVVNSELTVDVFTTRPDTLFGATFMVLCPEHQLIEKIKEKITNLKEIKDYIKKARKKSDLERTDLNKDKSGIEIKGIRAINLVNNKEIPIFVADYVLSGYGTGAIMAVPAHDERDWEFAKKYGIEIKEVVMGGKNVEKEVYIGSGVNVNSEFLDGLETQEAIAKMIEWLEKKKIGKRAINFRLRDWCVSRQRYWGPPIPMIECAKCGWQPVPEKDLPVLLPDMDDFLPDGTGKGPLNKVKEFVKTVCPKCGGEAERETDVSDPFVDSCWYYLRYPCMEFADQPFDKKRLAKWMPVNMYIGGKEHTVLHLLYSRFITMVLHDLGYLKEEEPFKRFFAHGLLIKEGAKMSKSKGNIINPDEYIEKFGADSVRLYLMFLGDVQLGGDWRDSGMAGMFKFVNRFYNLTGKILEDNNKKTTDVDVLKVMHKAVKRVGGDLEKIKFNTAIAAIMECINSLYELKATGKKIGADVVEILAKIIAPLAPFMAEELWNQTGHKKSIFKEKWPEYDKNLIQDEEFGLVVQINGKVRDRIKAKMDIAEDEAKKITMQSEKIKNFIGTKSIRKIFFVKNRLINIVVS